MSDDVPCHSLPIKCPPLGGALYLYGWAHIVTMECDMTVSNGDIIRATAVLAGPSGSIQNVFNFRAEVIILGSDLQVMTDIAQHLDDAYATLGTSLSSDTVFVEVQGHNLTTNNPMPTVPWPTATVGTGSASSHVAQVALMGLLRTGISRVLGRKFIGGLAVGDTDTNGFFDSSHIAHMASFLAFFIGTFIATSLNSYLPGVKSTKTGLFWSFIEGVTSGIPGIQRRRRQGRGI